MSDPTTTPILAIDTSGMTLRMAIGYGEDRLVKYEEAIRISHGRVMLNKIDHLLQSAGMPKSDLGAVAVSVGPGSFTGLRIGVALAKGLALGLNLDVVAVSTFELAAYRLADRTAPVTVLVPFKKDACFTASVAAGKFLENTVAVLPYAELSGLMPNESLVAVGAEISALAKPHGVNGSLPMIELSAADLVNLGRLKLAEGTLANIETLEPMYLQKSQAELRFEQRQRGQ